MADKGKIRPYHLKTTVFITLVWVPRRPYLHMGITSTHSRLTLSRFARGRLSISPRLFYSDSVCNKTVRSRLAQNPRRRPSRHPSARRRRLQAGLHQLGQLLQGRGRRRQRQLVHGVQFPHRRVRLGLFRTGRKWWVCRQTACY